MNLVESRITIIITYTLLGIAAFTALFPIALMLLNSLKTTPEIALSPLGMPEVPYWNNYVNAWCTDVHDNCIGSINRFSYSVCSCTEKN
jgi:raffinose/stachyose/melibiose transport system permease protein